MTIPLILTQAIPDQTGVRLMARVRDGLGVLITQASLSSITAVVTDLTLEKAQAGSGFVSSTTLTIANVVFNQLQTDLTWQKDSAANPSPPPPFGDGLYGFNFAWVVPAINFATSGHRFRVDVKMVPVSGEQFVVPFEIPTFHFATEAVPAAPPSAGASPLIGLPPFVAVSSFNGRTGAVFLTNADVVGAVGSIVNTFNGRSGPVTLTAPDLPLLVGDSGQGGIAGAAPAPAQGDAAAGKFLSAGGGWAVPTGAAGMQNYSASSGPLTPQITPAKLNWNITLDANLTINAPTGSAPTGSVLSFYFKQDATGYRTVTFDSSMNSGSTGTNLPFIPRKGPNQSSWIRFRWNGDGTATMIGFDGIDVTKAVKLIDYGGYVSGGQLVNPGVIQTIINDGYNPLVPANCQVPLTQPIIINGNSQGIWGEDRETSIIQCSSHVGGGVVFVPSYSGITTVAALATGPGAAGHFTSAALYYLGGISDNPQTSLNGLSAFTVDFFLRLNSDTGDAVILGCYGKRSLNDAAPITFKIGYNAGTPPVALNGTVNIGGSSIAFNTGSTTVPTGTIYHIAVTYDGANVRTFVNGALAGTFAATGNVVQNLAANWTIGGLTTWIYEGSQLSSCPNADLDGIRISKTARWTSAFTAPTSKPAWDSNTLFLHNFDNEHGQVSVAKSAQPGGAGYFNHWLLVRRLDGLVFNSSGFLRNLQIQNTANVGPGARFRWCTNARVENCTFKSPVAFEDNAYKQSLHNCWFIPPSGHRYALLFGSACGAFVAENLRFESGQYQFVIGSSGGSVLGASFAQQSDTVLCLLVSAGSGDAGDEITTLVGFLLDVEVGGTTMEAGALLSNAAMVAIFGGDWDVGGVSSIPAIKMDACIRVSIFGGSFSVSSNSQEIINVITANTYPTHVYGCARPKTETAPWSNSTGAVIDDANIAYTNLANIFTLGPQQIRTGADANKAQIITRNSSSQSVDLSQWEASAGKPRARVTSACEFSNPNPNDCTGLQNEAFGAGAAQNLTSGVSNTAVGYQALNTLTTGTGNVAIGTQALQSANGLNNLGLGSGAASNLTSGANNVVFGNSAGQGSNPGTVALTTGSRNVLIGTADTKASNTNDGIAIGQGAAAATGEFALTPNVNFQTFYVYSSTNALRQRADFTVSNVDNTDATRKYRIVHNVWDTVAREALRFETDGSGANASLFGAGSFGSGRNVLFVNNAAVNPGANPTGGGILYSNAGAGTWRGSSGTVTAFGPAGPHCGQCGYDHWRAAYRNDDWGSYLYECGMCGKVYKRGPVSVLERLTPEQRAEVLT